MEKVFIVRTITGGSPSASATHYYDFNCLDDARQFAEKSEQEFSDYEEDYAEAWSSVNILIYDKNELEKWGEENPNDTRYNGVYEDCSYSIIE